MPIALSAPEQIVLVRFTDVTARGAFTDVLRYTKAEFDASTAATRLLDARARRDAWVTAQGVPPVQPTRQDLEAQIASLEANVAEQEARIEEVGPRTRAQAETRLRAMEATLAARVAAFVARFGART